jgi:hypothetical protein
MRLARADGTVSSRGRGAFDVEFLASSNPLADWNRWLITDDGISIPSPMNVAGLRRIKQ